MESHILTEEDEWFLRKGQKDSLSKTPFEVGQTVVVCEHKHVMLAEFYSGECPTCHSRNTVPFSRPNVEQGILRSYVGACPKCSKEVTILFRQYGANNPFIGRCPRCNNELFISEKAFGEQALVRRFRAYIDRMNIALRWICCLLIIGIIVLTLTGNISSGNLIDYSKKIILPRTQGIYQRFLECVVSNRFHYAFIVAAEAFCVRNVIFFQNIIFHFAVFADGLKELGVCHWEQLCTTISKTSGLIELFERRTEILIERIRPWVEKVISYF